MHIPESSSPIRPHRSLRKTSRQAGRHEINQVIRGHHHVNSKKRYFVNFHANETEMELYFIMKIYSNEMIPEWKWNC